MIFLILLAFVVDLLLDEKIPDNELTILEKYIDIDRLRQKKILDEERKELIALKKRINNHILRKKEILDNELTILEKYIDIDRLRQKKILDEERKELIALKKKQKNKGDIELN